MAKSHFLVPGFFDHANKPQLARVTIEGGRDGSDPPLLSLRISGRHEVITIPWGPELEKMYQREKKAKLAAQLPKRRRRYVAPPTLRRGI